LIYKNNSEARRVVNWPYKHTLSVQRRLIKNSGYRSTWPCGPSYLKPYY